jgi:hypothetical protein
MENRGDDRVGKYVTSRGRSSSSNFNNVRRRQEK